jgi:endonuclease YncB( thermonuclease family)
MSELLFGKDVELQAHTIDRHWRLVARVLVDGQDAGFELLKQGLCWVYERYLPEASPDIQASYQQAQAVAREQKFGLWSDPFPVPPWDWRKGEKERSRMAQDAV